MLFEDYQQGSAISAQVNGQRPSAFTAFPCKLQNTKQSMGIFCCNRQRGSSANRIADVHIKLAIVSGQRFDCSPLQVFWVAGVQCLRQHTPLRLVFLQPFLCAPTRRYLPAGNQSRLLRIKSILLEASPCTMQQKAW